MALDLAVMHSWIERELRRRSDITTAMANLITACEKKRPHPDWIKLRALPYGDLTALRSWIEQPFREEPPGPSLRGLWFGLFNPLLDDDTPVADLYVCGSERFDPHPDDNEWAVGPDWWPEARYAESSVLADIYCIA